MIAPGDRSKFEQVANLCFPGEMDFCPEFLRHKTFVIQLSVLTANGVTVNHIVQETGEVILIVFY